MPALTSRILGLVVLLCAAGSEVFCSDVQATPRSDRPNIVVILADDFGYECVGGRGQVLFSENEHRLGGTYHPTIDGCR